MVNTIKCFRQVCKKRNKNVISVPCLFSFFSDIKDTVLGTVHFPKSALVF